MKRIKQTRNIVKYNLGTWIGFELIFKLLTFPIFIPVILNALHLIMKITGYTYLTPENIRLFETHPVTVITFVLLLLLAALYMTFDITTVIIILDQSYQKKKIKIIDAVRLSLGKCRTLFRLRYLPSYLLSLLFLPFLNFGMIFSFIAFIKIPDSVLKYFLRRRRLLWGSGAAVAVIAVLLLYGLYIMHYLVIEDVSFKEARKRNRSLGRKHHIKDMLFMVALQAAIALLYNFFAFSGISLIVLLNRFFGGTFLVSGIITTVIWEFITISFLIFSVISTPISYMGISILFYLHKEDKGEEIYLSTHTITETELKKDNRLRKWGYVIALTALVCGTVFAYGMYKGDYNLNIEYARTLEVTAHRGASKDYPENTMSAFAGACELGADWIELDVQQTKDGKIVVSHDANLKRTTGLNRNIWELTYEEIRELDAGSFFDESFCDERIPLLEEVITFAKENNIRLNIELKPSGHETDFEKEVIDIVREQEFQDDCVITSQVYSVLLNVKKYDETIKTVYVSKLVYGNIALLSAADHFSVEATSITRSLVNRIHNEGKQIYAWTVNSERTIGRMISMNVDNIITDNVVLAKETIYSEKTSSIINEYVRQLQHIFY